ncbi:MAG: hypothetical protein CBD32_02940 [Actinobacteria bacterium TMED172]|nr:hypothetical protein [Cellvibrionales bacterium]OUW33421.1 MAG: hypothetical protein CBD32_02940 [Actinobacteria bacterium TMED172]|tara:strand:+ start:7010 stop:8185 length:1176 start_codon:yes stop_codon:yes gene_type:complete
MLLNLFDTLRRYGVPVTIGEFLDLLQALDKNLIFAEQEKFYHMSRMILVKDEKHFDKFDRAINAFFNGLESMDGMLEALIPDDWVRDAFQKELSQEELDKLQSFDNLEELIEKFKERLAEQEERHEGGNKWIGTGGTSPFGNNGFHPEGIRVGGEGKQNKAVKVWEKRDYKNLDGDSALGTRNIQLALRRLRKFARAGAEDLLDLDDTISSTARNAGLLDIKMVPERHNAVKVLIFFDIGGSMDYHVAACEQLFSAVRSEFKHLEFFYFHNFIYESVWKDNRRRMNESTSTVDILNKYAHDYKVIFVGDAAMSPYEIMSDGGSVEHWNKESGEVWMRRVLANYPQVAWINPVAQSEWQYSQSTRIIDDLFEGNMFPMTVNGLESCMAHLAR